MSKDIEFCMEVCSPGLVTKFPLSCCRDVVNTCVHDWAAVASGIARVDVSLPTGRARMYKAASSPSTRASPSWSRHRRCPQSTSPSSTRSRSSICSTPTTCGCRSGRCRYPVSLFTAVRRGVFFVGLVSIARVTVAVCYPLCGVRGCAVVVPAPHRLERHSVCSHRKPAHACGSKDASTGDCCGCCH